MRRFMTLLGTALVGVAAYSAIAPNMAQAQLVQVQVAPPYPTVVVPTYYSAPVYVAPRVTTTYSVPVITSSSYYPSTISYYPSPAPVYTYSAPPATMVAPVVTPAPGYYTTRTYYGYGIFRPRGYYSQTTYTPILR